MKYILNLFFVLLVLTGCTMKEQVVDMKVPGKNIGTPVVKPVEKVQETKIEQIEEKEIVEETVPFLESQGQVKIAFVYPSRFVAKYAKPSMATIMGYMSYIGVDYNLKVVDTKDENIDSIKNSLEMLKAQGFNNVIALFTPRVSALLDEIELDEMRIYLPLVEKNELNSSKRNLIFGSISYEDQINKLLSFSTSPKKTMFYQDSFLGKKLKAKFDSLGVELLVAKEIEKKRNYFRGLVSDGRFNNSTLFMNTDIVKTSLLLSQLTAYSIRPSVVMSTQNNYDPKLITLTQEKNRDNFVVANSIDDVSDDLFDEIDTFGGNIKYEWVDYSVLVGINYLYDSNSSNLIRTQIVDNKVVYEPRLFKSTDAGFLEIK